MTEKKGKKKDEDKTNKILMIAGIILIVIAILVVSFKDNANNKILKSEYSINEVGYIDDIEVSLEKAIYINNETGIEITFKITNKRNNTITITPDDYFVFYDINKVQIPNKFTNDTNIIKKDETITYKLQYDVTKKELYEIYFYSQIVENNIKFSFKSSDINSDIIEEKSLDEKEEQMVVE